MDAVEIFRKHRDVGASHDEGVGGIEHLRALEKYLFASGGDARRVASWLAFIVELLGVVVGVLSMVAFLDRDLDWVVADEDEVVDLVADLCWELPKRRVLHGSECLEIRLRRLKLFDGR